jgi:Zn-dependent M28 family amino/carboxypeptidase
MIAGKSDETGRGWGHTEADTLDKLDARNLREQAILLTELVVELAGEGTGIDHRDSDAIAEQLADEDLAEGMQITGDWPYDD